MSDDVMTTAVATGPIRLRGDGWSYRQDDGWRTDALGTDVGWVSDADTRSDGAVVIVQRRSPELIVVSREGELLQAVDLPGVVEPHGVFVTEGDGALVVDRDGHQVVRVTSEGACEVLLGDDGRFSHPTDVVVHPDTGDLYVTDGYGNAKVHQFTADGEPVRTWGRHGIGRGEFSVVHTLAVDTRGRLLVADRENGRIQLFSPDGELVDLWEGFHRPLGIHVDPERQMVLVSEGSTRLTARDLDGAVVGTGRAPDIAHGLTGDNAGAIYLTLPNTRRVVKLSAVA